MDHPSKYRIEVLINSLSFLYLKLDEKQRKYEVMHFPSTYHVEC